MFLFFIDANVHPYSCLISKPITTVSASFSEFERIISLMEYRGKDEESTNLVQNAAKQVYALLKNLCRLFLRRRKVMTLRIEKKTKVSDNVKWSSYLIRRLPQTVSFGQLHDLMRPSEDAIPKPIPRRMINSRKDDFTAITDIAVKQGKARTAENNIDVPSNLNMNGFDNRNTSRQSRNNHAVIDNFDERDYKNRQPRTMEQSRGVANSSKTFQQRSSKPNAQPKYDATKENLMNGRDAKINQIHASYTDGNGVLHGFEEVKL